jgi:pseudaminic acid biosynthesis-associated methylase
MSIKIKYRTNQEKFWSKEFGNNYISRNLGSNNRILTIGNALKSNRIKLKSALELGCNVGYNLDALKKAYKGIDLYGVEINQKAFGIVKNNHTCFNDSILNFKINKKFDLVFTAGVLIHQDPRTLNRIYKKIFSLSKKYIYISEYFNPTPITVSYRNHKDKLFKRDFAKDLINLFPELKVVNYGFFWKEDPKLKGNCDNSNWFLLKK